MRTVVSGPGPSTASLRQMQARQREVQREQKIANDTDRLLALIAEFKKQMDGPEKSELSLNMAKKLEEIEKLAHNLKNEMKQ
jgi:hypothetical protein